MELEKAGQKNSYLTVRFKEQIKCDSNFLKEINLIVFDLGISTSIDEFEADRVFNFLKHQFKNLTVEMLKEAFLLFSAKKLTFADPRFGHYDKFSNTFVGSVIHAYTEYKRKEESKPKLIDKSMHLPVPKEDIKEAFVFIKKVFESEEALPKIANWSDAFLYMENEKMINLTIDEKIMFSEMVKEDLKEERNYRKQTGRDISKLIDVITNRHSLAMECRKRLVCKYFEDQIKEK